MSWFWRGFQSAIFYYVSCAPCSKFAYQRRRKKDNKRGRAEHAISEAEQGLYRHPSPFNTNVYWKEEMAMGPGPPQRKQREQKERERERERQRGNRGLATGGVGSSAVTGTSSADTVIGSEAAESRMAEQERSSGEGWNRRRYQREDEMLWGIHVDNSTRKGTPKAGRSRAGTASSAGSYKYGTNPAVNDLHPPIVSKEPANRSRSGSGGSYGSGLSNASSRRVDLNLGRQMGERLIEERMRCDASLDSNSAAKVGSREDKTSVPSGQPHDRDRRPSNEWQISSTRSPPPPPLSIASDLRPPASRPPLSTINSTSNAKSPSSPNLTPTVNSKRLRPALLPMDSSSSLHMLQELVSPLSLDTSTTGTPMPPNMMRRATSPLPEASIELPAGDISEERDLSLRDVKTRFPTKEGWQLSHGAENVAPLSPVT
ncbi:hypothetical protein G7Y79_00026g059340 [Physcia stellaris]|nr:hypothetical protein G7Y79_00026g059340 [Physcia stellaris]